MAQPGLRTVHFNRPLTNMSVAYIQDDMEFIANKIFPVVPVTNKSDDYYVYDKETFVRAIAETREGAEESRGIGWKRATASYNCTQKSIHHDVPIDIAGNSDEELDPYNDAIAVVSRSMLLRQEKDLATAFFKTGVWTTDVTPAAADKWDAYDTSDPYTQIKTAIRSVQLAAVVKPNTLVLGPLVYDALSNHPELKDRFKYTTSESITTDILAKVLGIERVIVGEAVGASSEEGDALTLAHTYGKSAWLGYVNPRPSLLAPSAGYIFTWKIFGNKFGARIAKYPMRHLNDSQRIEGDMAYDIKIVAPDAGYFFNAAVS